MPAKGQQRKKQIINTAKEMFLKHGFQSTHIGEICDELSITRGTVYQYFSNKKEILFSILESIEEEFDDVFDIDDLIDFLETPPSSADLIKHQTERFFKTFSAIYNEQIVTKLVFNQIIGIDEEVKTQVHAFLQYLIRLLSKDLDYLKKQGHYKKEFNSKIMATSLVSSLFFMLYNNQHSNTEFSLEEAVSSLIKNLHIGVL